MKFIAASLLSSCVTSYITICVINRAYFETNRLNLEIIERLKRIEKMEQKKCL
jgi:hypothetical protein